MAKWLRQRIANPSCAGSTPARPFSQRVQNQCSAPFFLALIYVAHRTAVATGLQTIRPVLPRRTATGHTIALTSLAGVTLSRNIRGIASRGHQNCCDTGNSLLQFPSSPTARRGNQHKKTPIRMDGCCVQDSLAGVSIRGLLGSSSGTPCYPETSPSSLSVAPLLPQDSS